METFQYPSREGTKLARETAYFISWYKRAFAAKHRIAVSPRTFRMRFRKLNWSVQVLRQWKSLGNVSSWRLRSQKDDVSFRPQKTQDDLTWILHFSLAQLFKSAWLWCLHVHQSEPGKCHPNHLLNLNWDNTGSRALRLGNKNETWQRYLNLQRKDSSHAFKANLLGTDKNSAEDSALKFHSIPRHSVRLQVSWNGCGVQHVSYSLSPSWAKAMTVLDTQVSGFVPTSCAMPACRHSAAGWHETWNLRI